MNVVLKPSKRTEIERMVAMLGSVLQPRSATYVSSPITSGRRLLHWHISPQRTEQRFEEMVLRPNLEDAVTAITRIRASVRQPVIDPTALPSLVGWSQDDYRYLWRLVIESFANEVVFLDGWAYSSGCAYEFLIATTLELMTRSLNGSRISLLEAIDSIRIAENETSSVRADASFLRAVRIELEALQNGEPTRTEGTRVQR